MRKTPLNEAHKKLGGRLIDFGGWELPVQYTSILEEHDAVRNHAGIFDVSHMGEIDIKGREATIFINHLVTNDVRSMQDLEVLYSPMCEQNGGCVDDLLIYKRHHEDYLLVVNASNTEKDFEWIKSNKGNYLVTIENKSDYYAQIAVQGPEAEKIIQKMTTEDLNLIPFYTFKENVKLGETNLLISRTGYTGEDGFEIYLKAAEAESLFLQILKEGKEEGMLPCGLGARDTLRFESALPLYGHELSADITPVEAGLKIFIKTEKQYFIGQEVLKDQIDQKKGRMLVGFEMIDKGIARNSCRVFNQEGKDIGQVTSGSYSPTLKKNLGLALVEREFIKPETEIYVKIREKTLKAKIVKKPFYSKNYKK